MRKKNPNRIPRTQEDVDRAWHKGADFAMQFCLNIVLYVLKDKHDAPDEDILQLRDESMYVIDSYNRGYIKDKDIKETLKGDYDLSVTLV